MLRALLSFLRVVRLRRGEGRAGQEERRTKGGAEEGWSEATAAELCAPPLYYYSTITNNFLLLAALTAPAGRAVTFISVCVLLQAPGTVRVE
jgi:hypothetical protein